MKRFLGISLFVFLFMAINSNAQTKSDEEAVRKIPQAFADAWAKHHGHQLATIMTDDVDFVTVGATGLHGRSDFELYHTCLLGERFKEASLTPLESAVRFLRPELAVLHWSWRMEGDKNPDGTARKARIGLMTMIAEKKNGAWLVIVSQNANAMPGTPPELQGIKPPIAMPSTDQKP